MKRHLLVALASLCCFLSAGRSQEPPADSSLSVHEWGTFTSIAGAKGEAVVWSPQAERDDLPSFVEHLRNNQFKGGLQGTVRMETPVLYFYTPHPTTVSVQVSFAKGLLTEWYPQVGPEAIIGALAYYARHPERIDEDMERQERTRAEIAERSVAIQGRGASGG